MIKYDQPCLLLFTPPPKSPIRGKLPRMGSPRPCPTHLPAARNEKRTHYDSPPSFQVSTIFAQSTGAARTNFPWPVPTRASLVCRHCLRKDLATSQAVQRGAHCLCQRTVIAKVEETSLRLRHLYAATVLYCLPLPGT